MVFDYIEVTFEFDPYTNYFVILWLPVQEVTRKQYEILTLGLYQHNKIIKNYVPFHLSKLS